MRSETCPTESALEGFQLGRLSERDLRRVAEHLEKCADCQLALERFDGTVDDFLQSLRTVAADGKVSTSGAEGSMGEQTTGIMLALVKKEPFEGEIWDAFVQKYQPSVLSWCQRWGLQDADAHDLTQDVFLKLLAKMRDFQYDPNSSFRAWLKTVVQHMILDFVAKQSKQRGSGDSDALRLLHQVEARVDLIQRLEEAFDQELMTAAMERVKQRVEPHTWEAFRLTHLEQLPGTEAATRLSMRVAHVFVAKRRVLRMVQEEISNLEKPQAASKGRSRRRG